MHKDIIDIDDIVLFSLEQERLIKESYNQSVFETRLNTDDTSNIIMDFILKNDGISLKARKTIVKHGVGEIVDKFKSVPSTISSSRYKVEVEKDRNFLSRVDSKDGFNKELLNNINAHHEKYNSTYKIMQEKINDFKNDNASDFDNSINVTSDRIKLKQEQARKININSAPREGGMGADDPWLLLSQTLNQKNIFK